MPSFMTDWSSFRYCPKCGSGDMRFQGKRLYCNACSFTFYINPGVAVGALIVDEEKGLLVAIRGQDPGKGTWDIPGGFAEPGETAEQTLYREVQEELGVQIISHEYFASAPNIYPYRGVVYHTTDLVFRCQIDHPDRIQAADDIADIHYVPILDLKPEPFAMVSIRRIIAQFLESEGSK